LRRKKVLSKLKTFFNLVKKQREWGGYIKITTGEIKGPYEGEKYFVEMKTPEEERKMNRNGWIHFHTHPENELINSEPSAEDILSAHCRGGGFIIITKNGIWEVAPKKVLSLRKIRQINKESWEEAEKLAKIFGEEPYLFWKEIIKEKLPTKMILHSLTTPDFFKKQEFLAFKK
jgi:hypothetical protein